MASFVPALLVVGVLGLALNGLRLYGLVAVAILALQWPIAAMVALVLGVAVFIFNRYFS